MTEKLKNYINGQWVPSAANEWLPVINPATAEVLGEVPLSPAEEVDQAAQAAAQAAKEVPGTEAAIYREENLTEKITVEDGEAFEVTRLLAGCGKSHFFREAIAATAPQATASTTSWGDRLPFHRFQRSLNAKRSKRVSAPVRGSAARVMVPAHAGRPSRVRRACASLVPSAFDTPAP